MNIPCSTPLPPQSRPRAPSAPGRRLLAIGACALLIAGLTACSTGSDGQTGTKPATTITATTTATPEPGPTVTETVKAKSRPGPTVTVTKTATAQAAGSGSDDSSGQDSTGSCSVVSNSGNCYSAGQFCRNEDHGALTTTESGTKIKCEYSSNAWRWTYV